MSRKQAIEAFCKACIYDPGQKGTWKEQTGACQSKGCPLYPYRPKTARSTLEPSKID